MKILALDTSSIACSVALLNGTERYVRHDIAPKQQTRQLLAMIDSLLSEASLVLSQLDAIAYGCGPGSFTGVRIANSVAQGLGYGLGLPLIPVSSMAALAEAACSEYQWQHVLVALDARSDQLYWASYVADSHGRMKLQGEERAVLPGTVSLSVSFPGAIWFGVGDGWIKYEQAILSALGIQPAAIEVNLLPTAEAILRLAQAEMATGMSGIAARDANPVYLR